MIIGIVIFIILIIIVVLVLIFNNNNETIEIKTIPEKFERKLEVENSNKIPYVVYQSWNTYDVSSNMYDTIIENVKMNPEFDFYIYDDIKSREFIVDNFDKEVVEAFDTLKPGAYKCDLWRLCVLYINGGVYMDMKFQTIIPLKNIVDKNENLFVKDLDTYGNDSIYQGFIVCKPKEEVLKKGIDKIVENVKNKFYGNNALQITGPTMLGPIVYKNSPETVKLNLSISNKGNKHVIIFKENESEILSQYSKYRLDQKLNGTKHYGQLWKEKDVYN